MSKNRKRNRRKLPKTLTGAEKRHEHVQEKREGLRVRLRALGHYSKRLKRRIARLVKRYPAGLPARYRELWDRPWTAGARQSPGFRRWLVDHGYLSPHFTLGDASGKHRSRVGSDVPGSLIPSAQRHAFDLEIVRHELGDEPLSPLSWYRNPQHNASVGGASSSRHMQADGTDWSTQTIARFGTARFDAVMQRVFRDGGFGRYPSGSRHGDSRGHTARW